jgi:hypothetical protein
MQFCSGTVGKFQIIWIPESFGSSYFSKWTKVNNSNYRHCYYYYMFEINKNKTEVAYVRFEVFTAVAMKNGVFWDGYFFAAYVGC